MSVGRGGGGGGGGGGLVRLHRRSFTTDPALSWARQPPFPPFASPPTSPPTSASSPNTSKLLTFSAASSGLYVLPRYRHDTNFKNPPLTSTPMCVSLPRQLQTPLNPLILSTLPLSHERKHHASCQKPEKPFVRSAQRPGHY